MDWKKCCAKDTATFVEVVRILDKASLQFVMVVDENDFLRGVVTDGDIRRAILCGTPMDAPVIDIMNHRPLTFLPTDSKAFIISRLHRSMLRQAPLVTEDGKVIGLYLLEDLLMQSRRDNAVILMVGGLGTRLRPLTNDCPKPLLKVGNKPILETILESFIEQGFYQFYFAVNYKAEMIEAYFGNGSRWDVEISYIHETKRMGTAGALSLLHQHFPSPVIVMNGDLLTKLDFSAMIDLHEAQEAKATMAVRKYAYQVPYGIVEYEGKQILRITEKPVHNYYVNAGIYVLSPEVVDSIDKEEFLDMPDIFSELIAKREKAVLYPIEDYWLDIGHPEDFEKAQSEWA